MYYLTSSTNGKPSLALGNDTSSNIDKEGATSVIETCLTLVIGLIFFP
ncbi:MAG: hypothetical protein AAF789_06460 [Bacteroidota bacterium]